MPVAFSGNITTILRGVSNTYLFGFINIRITVHTIMMLAATTAFPPAGIGTVTNR
jgi:hypothetical protein